MEKIIVSKCKISVNSSDGSLMELDFVMPKEIQDKIMLEIMLWKDNWVASTATIENYQKEEQIFLEKLKNEK